MKGIPTALTAAMLLVTTPLGALEEAVSLDAIRAHLDFLASDALEGRDTGTRGFEVAALYAASQFRQWGLEPGNGSWYLQPVQLVETRRVSTAIAALRDGASTALDWKGDYLFHGRSGHTEVAVEAPVVFAGFGVDAPQFGHADYDGVDVAGKVVLMLSGAPPSFASEQRAHFAASRQKRIEAERRGAVGVVTVRTRDDDRRSPWSRSTLNADRPSTTWRHPGGAPADDTPGLRFSLSMSHDGLRKMLAGATATADELLDVGDAGGSGSRELDVSLRVEARLAQHELSSPNVVAVLRGSDPELADELVVCTAHLDHVGIGAEVDGDAIYNGFYDNAMGSAMVLEMARVLAASPERPRRSIAFVLVTGEERGLLGSEYFAAHPSVAGATVIANVNIDMPLFLHPVADVVAFGAEHTTLGDLARAAAAEHGFALSPDPQPEESIFVRSDQYSFVRRGVPAIYLDNGWASRDGETSGKAAVDAFRERHYHRPSDESELGADWDGVGRFTAANAELARSIADADERPRWLEGSFFGELFAGDAAQGSGDTPSSP